MKTENSLIGPPNELNARGDYAQRDPETYSLSEKEEIVFAIFVVVYISPKHTNLEYKTRTYKETNVINIQYEGKSEQFNEDAKKFGIKIKLKWITKRC